MLVSEFDFSLPPALIAQHPAAQRSASRLLYLRADGTFEDLSFRDLPELVGPADAVVVNDTRVIKARLTGRKGSGGKVEVLVARLLGRCEAMAMIRASHPPAPGSELFLADGLRVGVVAREGELYHLRFAQDIEPVLERLGAVPLPPYIVHAPGEEDLERYQTVYAAVPGAVAAPTAGLHFDAQTLAAIEARGAALARLTLHVGAGTFQPVRVEEVEAHRMHPERFAISGATRQAIRGRRVLAVGTTTLRALESAARSHALESAPRGATLEGETDLFIYPGFEFRVVKRLLTNFHLPRSTLLMLVCAFAGRDRILAAYRHAIERRYRFFSYGDAMLIDG
ncbi:MAG TPA: tRNA preQ1(34) S-adenosylmethionine ribosyltransferase-isomerase QueA [Burkholderiales bacterium]|nr:tRNA preQ1(34) S-adenosylmethionine ribosyltransferase-isomerase QueA [Burkholderiales bacterium]